MLHRSRVTSPFAIRHLGIVMRPRPGQEPQGLHNPAAVRGSDGELYLYPTISAKNGYSRIGLARVHPDGDGHSTRIERLGYALEPEESYELRPQSKTGGVRDARVTYVETLGLYVMAYVAWGAHGSRVALAVSENCLDWERLGPADFQPDLDAHYGVLFNRYQNSGAAFAPEIIERADGTATLGMLHRPFYDKTRVPKGVGNVAPGIWLSMCDFNAAKRDIRHLCVMNHHTLVATPEHEWESLRIGLGAPMVRTPLGLMIVYRGASVESNRVTYDTGVLFFRREKNRLLRYRSWMPIHGVRCPTGIDKRSEDTYDIYFDTPDGSIGVARMHLPDALEYEEIDQRD